MNNDIKHVIDHQKKIVLQAQIAMDSAFRTISYLQKVCSHTDKTSWTNDDGDGSFIVEKCNICGLQKDGGL